MGPGATPEQVAARSRQLAEERAPGLIEEYEEIGGSPLHRRRGSRPSCWRPSCAAAATTRRAAGHAVHLAVDRRRGARGMRELGVERLVALPVYPLCGPSTTVAALEELDAGAEAQGWDVPVHADQRLAPAPGYLRLRAEAIRRVLEENGLTLDADGTRWSSARTARR
jgi:protoporphyrin/coproporphyrin ferrochelatase